MFGIELQGIELCLGDFDLRISLRVPDGSCAALVGPSGSGKSTLLAIIAGFEKPERGRIRIHGVDASHLPPEKRPVATLFQEHNLFPHLNVQDNVGLGIHPGLRLGRQDRMGVATALARVGLTGRARHLPRELSGGERQRAALARTLVQDRPVLLLDEPFAALGPGLRREMLALVEEIRRERSRTVLLVSHQPEDATRIASLAFFVHEGRVLAEGPPDKLFHSPSRSEIEGYLGGAGDTT